jgi:ribosomal protein S12 methylthiotransferase accessory factor
VARGAKKRLFLRDRAVVYTGNGFRAVPLTRTLADLERFFLTSGVEVQLTAATPPGERPGCSVLGYLSPAGPEADERYFGKGAGRDQALASACMEFIERAAAKMRSDDARFRASFADLGSEARDPRLFSLAADSAFDPGKSISWCWGYSLTRAKPVLVPANLVFLPFHPDVGEDAIAWSDSNGLASGNTPEEAVLHALLEVVERDASITAEYNRLPLPRLRMDGAAGAWSALLASLEAEGFECSAAAVPTDHAIPIVSVFLRKRADPANCAVAFGCYLDPAVAVSRALTEAIQLLPPPPIRHAWSLTDSPARYAAAPSAEIALASLKNLARDGLKANIERCVAILEKIGSEVIVVDLSVPDIPFPVVRVLATGLQPIAHGEHLRLSRRFFDVPVTLGLRREPIPRDQIEIWPLCGYR